jgi:O-antigen/teichoic acid export membrane protein
VQGKVKEKVLSFYSENEKHYQRSSLLYLLTSFISSGFTFVLISILSKRISTFDFGVIEVFLSISALFTGVITYGADNFIVEIIAKTNEKIRMGDLFSMMLINSLLCCLISLPLLQTIYPEIWKNLLLPVCLYAVLNCFYTFYLKYLQTNRSILRYALIVITYSVLNFSITILLLLFSHYDGYVIRIAGYLVPLFFFLPVFSLIWLNINKQVTFSKLKYLYFLGFPLLIAHITGWAIEKADRILITEIISPEEAGIYGVGYQLASIVLVVESALSRAWLPNIIKRRQEGNLHKLRSDMRKTVFILILITIFSILAASIYLKFFVDPKFGKALYIIIIVSVGYLFDGVWKLYLGYLIVDGKTKIYSYSVVIGSILNVCLNLILIPFLGINGAAIATLLSFVAGAAYVRHKVLQLKLTSI